MTSRLLLSLLDCPSAAGAAASASVLLLVLEVRLVVGLFVCVVVVGIEKDDSKGRVLGDSTEDPVEPWSNPLASLSDLLSDSLFSEVQLLGMVAADAGRLAESSLAR